MKASTINHIIRYPIVAFMMWIAITWSLMTIYLAGSELSANGPDLQILPMIVFCTSCLLSSIGLILKKKFGWIFGYAIVFGICGMFIGEAITHWDQTGHFTLEDIGWSVLFAGTPLIMGLGMRRIAKTEIEPFTTKDRLLAIGIVLLLGVSTAVSAWLHQGGI